MKSQKKVSSFSFRSSPDDNHYPFAELKELMAGKGLTPAEKTANAESADEELSEDEFFNRAMKDVREIPEFRGLPVRQKKRRLSFRRNTVTKASQLLEDVVRGRRPMELFNTAEYLEWVNPDFGSADAKGLHEGRFSVQDFLDLHGCSLEEAAMEVELFLKESVVKGLRCVKIIHGRGLRSPRGPVLKEALRQWLSGRHRKQVIAFVTARQCDGGLGAVFVLLRRG